MVTMKRTTITEQTSTLEVEHLGARKLLTLENIPLLVKVKREDGKVGSTHPCTPIFGPDTNNLFGLNQHGNTRNQRTQVKKLDANQIEITHTIKDPNYPKGVDFQQHLTLEKNLFKLRTRHTNTGETSVPVNSGEHCYFDAPEGFQGTTVNEQDITQIIENHKDGVPVMLQKINVIHIPGKPKIILEQEGYNFAMLWVGSSPSTGEKDTNYVCIEPVESNPQSNYFGSEESFIDPGMSRMAMFSLALESANTSAD